MLLLLFNEKWENNNTIGMYGTGRRKITLPVERSNCMKKFGVVCYLIALLNGFSQFVVFADTGCPETGNISIQNESLPAGIDMSIVTREATKKLKEEGFENIPEIMEEQLEAGLLSQADYETYYPTAGAGYIDWVCYVEELTEQNLIEAIVGQIKVSQGYNAFFIGGFKGLSAGGAVIIRIYRATT